MSVARLNNTVTPKISKAEVCMTCPLLEELAHLCVDRDSCVVEAQIHVCVQKLNVIKRHVSRARLSRDELIRSILCHLD